MSTNKLYSYRCNACLRVVERLSDGRRPDPLRCVITDKCPGTLSLFKKRIGFQPMLTPPVIGLDDRRFRGSAPITAKPVSLVEVANLNVFGGAGGLALACLEASVSGGTVTFSAYTGGSEPTVLETRSAAFKIPSADVEVHAVLFELSPEVLLARRYTYYFSGSASVIEGQDSTTARSLLRYTESSIVKVLVNGIELDESEFDRTAVDSITLTPSVTSSTIIVDVYVYRNITSTFDESLAVRLKFKHLDITSPEAVAVRQQCAWGDALAVARGSSSKLVSYCSSLDALDRSKTYAVGRFEVSVGENVQPLDTDNLFLLTAQPPYAFEDKRLDRIAVGADIVDPTTALSFRVSEATGDLSDLVVAESLITKLGSRLKLSPAVTFDDVASATGTARPIAVPPQAYIIGPA